MLGVDKNVWIGEKDVVSILCELVEVDLDLRTGVVGMLGTNHLVQDSGSQVKTYIHLLHLKLLRIYELQATILIDTISFDGDANARQIKTRLRVP